MTKARTAIALVASGERRDAIVLALSDAGFQAICFDCLQALLDNGAADAVVVWVEDTTASIPNTIAPLCRGHDDLTVVIACESIERWEMRAALAAGVTGVVVADGLSDSIGPCLHAVRAGQICVPREHWRQVQPPALSAREKQILGLVVMGYMNSQIAEQLFLAESTIKSHLSSAFGKLGVRSRNEAVELIVNPERGLGMGILGLGGEPLEAPEPAGAGTR
jgi:DNA-binding NarL/FixJ family response regulator